MEDDCGLEYWQTLGYQEMLQEKDDYGRKEAKEEMAIDYNIAFGSDTEDMKEFIKGYEALDIEKNK